ncbi:hypothetical protein [Anaerobutyricum soehngenii]|uniref:hypothetical protein n=1 Tax=Anaerobutyricum soehngenii TaxID=105843 RepID=UPI001ADDD48A|nr:hypothetical protein [Anaerobutyricum soehngenii]
MLYDTIIIKDALRAPSSVFFCYFIHWGKQTKKEIISYPICSVVAVVKMLIRILNTLPSRIWDMI